jgi:hypothetical protein
VVALGPAGGAALVCGPGATVALDDAEVSRGEGTLRLAAEGGELILGLAAQTSQLGFETGAGREVGVQAVGASGELRAAGSAEPIGLEASGVSWTIAGEDDQGALRTAWAMLADGSLLVLFSLRPAAVDHHGSETVGAVRIAKDGAVTPFAEPLISTEYDAAGRQTRATLELWGENEDGLAVRGGGRRAAGGTARLGGGTLEAARFEWRVDGVGGLGGYEIISA